MIERIKMVCRQLWDNTPMVTRNLLAISFIAWLADAVLMRLGIHLSTYLGLVDLWYVPWWFGFSYLAALHVYVYARGFQPLVF